MSDDSQAAQAALTACNAAVKAGDAEATDRHWREFVRILWKPMEATVPWEPKQEERLP